MELELSFIWHLGSASSCLYFYEDYLFKFKITFLYFAVGKHRQSIAVIRLDSVLEES